MVSGIYSEKSRDIKKSIKSYASMKDIDPNRVDFEIVETANYLLVNRSLDLYDPIDNLEEAIKKPYDIFQIHEISLFYSPSKKIEFPAKLKTKNDKFTHIVIEFDLLKFPEYRSSFLDDFAAEINKRLAYNRFLVDFCNRGFWSGVRAIVEDIKAKNLKENIRELNVCNGFHPVETRDGKLIFHYMNKIEALKEHDGKIDYAQRGFATGVEEGELLLEYIKPKLGKNGRDCYGRYLKRKKIDWSLPGNKLELKAGDNIEIVEDDDRIKYFAVKSGFVKKDRSNISIESELKINRIDMKSTGSIKGFSKGDMSIEISDHGSTHDAIGDLVEVEAHKIVVRGNVGAAKLKAEIIGVGGLVHSKANLKADDAEINLLKGVLEAKRAKVKNLEGGEISGELLEIGYAVGSKIRGESIAISSLGSNNTIYVSKTLKIASQKGEDCTIIADSSVAGEDGNKINQKERLFLELENIVSKEELVKKKSVDELFKTNKIMVYIKERINYYKKNSLKTPRSLLDLFEESNKKAEELNEYIKNLKTSEEILEGIDFDLHTLKKGIYDIRILMEGQWRGINKIIYVLPNKRRVEKIPEGSSQIIYLRDDENGEPMIESESYRKGD